MLLSIKFIAYDITKTDVIFHFGFRYVENESALRLG